MDQELLKELLSQYLSGKLSLAQKHRLADLLKHEEYREQFESIVRNDFLEDKYLGEENLELKSAIQNFLSKEISRTTKKPAKLLRFRRLVAAASVILFLAAVSSLFIFQKSNSNLTTATTVKNVSHDIPPGKTGAVLTLSDGSKIVLDSLQGSVGLQGHSQVINRNGLLSYSVKNNSSEVAYNTMSTPVGRQYQVILADDTKVWLNAASSITYPTSFPGDDRKVSITGEAYFEVVHDARKPFHVMINDIEVRVLGTHFNINAYENEDATKTTLIEGSVKVTKNNSNILIAPGQQAIAINGNNDLPVKKKEVDLDEVLAWKNSKFIFQDADIKSIMRQLERWYGITASYDGNVTNEEFVGVISRNVNISQILAMLEKTGRVGFRIQGKNIIVK
ncbi:MAG TPA: FecR domain-containing protein [Chitinophagaceae bacterium]|nr:FecR domain-containing protein [Chitinophagaceae bacterium]